MHTTDQGEVQMQREERQELSEDQFIDAVHRLIDECIDSHAQGELLTMCHYHFSAKGKALRPYFVMKMARAFDVKLDDALAWAGACEILHNATLVHDDIQDGDEYRRSIPTLWKKFGVSQAINVGDYLLMIAPLPLLHTSPGALQNELLKSFTVMSAKLVGGQSQELALNELTGHDQLLERYFSCIAGKTSALFQGLAKGVALMACLSAPDRQRLEKIFFELGQVFQMQDDVLDLYGDKQRKEVGCDIKEGKVSALVAFHLDHHPHDFALIKSILHKERQDTTVADIALLQNLFRESQTLNYCLGEISSRVQALTQDPYFDQNATLKELVSDLCQKILAPIDDLLRGQVELS